MPARIQRKRVRGWRSPPGCIYCGRPTIWGNPFVAWSDGKGRPCIALTSGYEVRRNIHRPEGGVAYYYRLWVNGELPLVKGLVPFTDRARQIRKRMHELRGHDLSCWCKPENPDCHVDVLLELANPEALQTIAPFFGGPKSACK